MISHTWSNNRSLSYLAQPTLPAQISCTINHTCYRFAQITVSDHILLDQPYLLKSLQMQGKDSRRKEDQILLARYRQHCISLVWNTRGKQQNAAKAVCNRYMHSFLAHNKLSNNANFISLWHYQREYIYLKTLLISVWKNISQNRINSSSWFICNQVNAYATSSGTWMTPHPEYVVNNRRQDN